MGTEEVTREQAYQDVPTYADHKHSESQNALGSGRPRRGQHGAELAARCSSLDDARATRQRRGMPSDAVAASARPGADWLKRVKQRPRLCSPCVGQTDGGCASSCGPTDNRTAEHSDGGCTVVCSGWRGDERAAGSGPARLGLAKAGTGRRSGRGPC